MNAIYLFSCIYFDTPKTHCTGKPMLICDRHFFFTLQVIIWLGLLKITNQMMLCSQYVKRWRKWSYLFLKEEKKGVLHQFPRWQS